MKLPHVSSRFGAPMGRVDKGVAPDGPVRLFRVRVNAGGYDDGGAYWGTGEALFCATDGADFSRFVRALDRDCAAAALGLTDQVRRTSPGPLLWWSSSSGRIEIQMTLAMARSAGHAGSCDAGVDVLIAHPRMAPRLAALNPAHVRDELDGYGCWGDDELSDHAANLRRLVWIAANDLVEGAQS